ncbi:MAG: hypothetical protein LBR43_01700 [Spiroplasmataceae bacterium]|jgi:hypothetical protein|nr:hypothetical protein [Spiroplasmataceae bacterium]
MDANKWLEINYPREERDKVKTMVISGWDYDNDKENSDWKKLTGYLRSQRVC